MACAPFRENEVLLTPPPLPAGRVCIRACAQSKEFAADRCRTDIKPCLDAMRKKAMADYDAYVQRQTLAKERIIRHARSFENPLACSIQPCYDSVNSDYFDCYEECGGSVEKK